MGAVTSYILAAAAVASAVSSAEASNTAGKRAKSLREDEERANLAVKREAEQAEAKAAEDARNYARKKRDARSVTDFAGGGLGGNDMSSALGNIFKKRLGGS